MKPSPTMNLLTLAALIAAAAYFGRGTSFYLLVSLGAVLSAAAGFASFSRGRFFVGGVGDAISTCCMFASVVLAVAIGWMHGAVWGLASMWVFWPVMYRAGVVVLLRLSLP